MALCSVPTLYLLKSAHGNTSMDPLYTLSNIAKKVSARMSWFIRRIDLEAYCKSLT